ncbi:hypothetical protein PM025_15340 [Halorubrum ezzemoulense]|uniref:hypothetical protein n=1 Tax=Halorubrum ezzemoulense TaxID=337243 RepID=UPI00232B5C38|nr:hypothetical protein [Halorubrum ezzemoulense]MDB2265485.1 hypothetical protein [Halorubrum ezzemoulense]MDB9302593.1 hypothetical protein [Halorubrum ezzemoulense]
MATTETNTTNGIIIVCCILEATAAGTDFGAEWADDVSRSDRIDRVLDSGDKATLGTAVPAGADYRVSTFGSNPENVSVFN